jgi:hypothetical protein
VTLNPQIIKKDGNNEFVVLPYIEFIELKKMLEDYEDILALRTAKSETINEPPVSYQDVYNQIIDNQ